jgi:hypothetical protein
MRLTAGRPRPVPPFLVVKNGLKTLVKSSSLIPPPSSETSTTASSGSSPDLDRRIRTLAFSVHGLDRINNQIQDCILDLTRVYLSVD